MPKTFIVAEIGQAHDGSLGMLHAYIDAVARTGVDAIKFQAHIAEAESSPYEPFRVNFSYEDKTRFDYWKRMEFTPSQWAKIKKHCEIKNLEFLCSPFSNAAVDLLEKLDIQKYKIGSGEVNNYLMLEKIARTGKDIILSSGMSSYDELDNAVDFLAPFKNKLAILQCTTCYPTNAEEIGLNVIAELKEKYHYPVGLSDHSGTPYPLLSAVTLGAALLEFHVVFHRRMFGPDVKASLTIEETEELVKGIRFIETMTAHKVDKNNNEKFIPLKKIFEKSLAVNKDLMKGHTLVFEDLEAKKPPGYGIDATDYRNVLGKQLKTSLKQWEFLTKETISE